MVKLDRSGLDRIDSILHLTRRLDIPVVAEGVERVGQLVELERLGCPLVQGFLRGAPAPAAELLEAYSVCDLERTARRPHGAPGETFAMMFDEHGRERGGGHG